MGLQRYAGVVIVALLCPSLSLAEAPPTAAIAWPWSTASQPLATSGAPHPAIARITVQERDGIALGSGSLVDIQGDQGLVITNWHVVRDRSGDIEVSFPNGFKSKAKVIKEDQEWDLAALVIWKPNVDPLVLASTAPRPGEILTIAGYGSGNFRAATARCTGYVAPNRSLPQEMVEVGTEARQGDSGGPILNERGEIAGVLFGAGGGTTSGSYVGRVRTFLSDVTPREPRDGHASSAEAIASTNPFVNASGTPHLMAAAQPPHATAAIEQTAAGWKAARQETPAIDVERMEPLVKPPASIPAPERVASRTPQVTFGTLPQTDDPPTSVIEPVSDGAEDRELLPVWSRPLPKPVAPPAEQGASISKSEAVTLSPELLGKNPFEQAKSALAMVGLVAVSLRLFRTRAKPAE